MADVAQSDHFGLARKFQKFLTGLKPLFEKSIGRRQVVEEKAKGELVGDLDIKIEKRIFEFLGKHFPDDAIASEETAHEWPPKTERYWIIDPVDGTHNFLLGLPLCGIMLALIENSRVALSVVFLPFEQNGFYFATRGKGAWRSQDEGFKQLFVSKEENLWKAFLLLEGPSRELKQSEFIRQARFATQRDRNTLSSCWSGTRLALGDMLSETADALISICNKPTDTLPLCLLVEEAGGRVTDLYGNAYSPENCSSLIYSNGWLHESLLDIAKKTRALSQPLELRCQSKNRGGDSP